MMKLLAFVAIFIVYLHSITSGLECYSCFDGIEGQSCYDAFEKNCSFTENEFCFTVFHDNKDDDLYCDEDFCLHKDCGFDASGFDASSYGLVCETAGTHVLKYNESGQTKTLKYSCCESDLCNYAGTAEYKSSLSNENSSSNKNNTLNQIALFYASALCFYIFCFY